MSELLPAGGDDATEPTPDGPSQRSSGEKSGNSTDTKSEGPGIQLKKPSTGQLAVRGVTRRCPWCGDRKAYFTSWWGRADQCRKCGRGYRRGDDAFELGAITVNIIFTFLSILIAVAIVLTLMLGTDVNVSTPMIIGIGVFFAFGLPAIFYPLTFTVWQSVDLFMRAPTEEELAGGEDAKL